MSTRTIRTIENEQRRGFLRVAALGHPLPFGLCSEWAPYSFAAVVTGAVALLPCSSLLSLSPPSLSFSLLFPPSLSPPSLSSSSAPSCW